MSVSKILRIQDLLEVHATTASSDYTSGAAVITGGVGIGGKLYTNDSITAQSGLTVTTGGLTATAGDITASADNVVVTLGDINVTAGTLNLDASGGAAVSFISDTPFDASSGTVAGSTFAGGVAVAKKIFSGLGMTAVAGGFTATAGDITADVDNVVVTLGDINVTAGTLNLDASGAADVSFISDTPFDASDSTTAGSTFAGGVAIAKKVWVGTGVTTTSGGFTATAGNMLLTSGNATLTDGIINLDKTTTTTLVSDSTATSTSTITGAATFAGGVGIAENLYVGGLLNVGAGVTITGDLTVNGTTTTVNSATLEIADNIIIANAGPASTKDAGFMVERYISDVIGEDAEETSVDHGGVAQAGTVSSITLGAGAHIDNDYYNGWYIVLTGGTGANAAGVEITDYNGTSKVATVDAWVGVTPGADTVYSLFNKRYAGLMLNEGTDIFELKYIPSQNITDLDFSASQYGGLKTSTFESTSNATVGGNLIVNGTFSRPPFSTTSLAFDATPYTVLGNDAVIFITNTTAFLVNLPTVASSVGKSYTFVKMSVDAFDITIDANGADTIDDGTSTILVLSNQYERVTIMGSASTFWLIV
jgi:hypothetical protein